MKFASNTQPSAAETVERWWLTGAQQLAVLDEPTNNHDLTDVKFLKRVVSDFRGTGRDLFLPHGCQADND